jgi:hypothetical protein
MKKDLRHAGDFCREMEVVVRRRHSGAKHFAVSRQGQALSPVHEASQVTCHE